MRPDGVSGADSKATSYNPEDLRSAKTPETINSIIDKFREAVNKGMDNIYADGKVDGNDQKGEMKQILDWIHDIDTMLGNLTTQMKAKCSESINSLKDLALSLFDATGKKDIQGENIRLAQEGNELALYDIGDEPDETDNSWNPFAFLKNMTKEELDNKAKELRIPERKFEAMSKFQRQIKEKYYACLEAKTNGMIASRLKCFQESYSEQLKDEGIAPSVTTDGHFELGTLYDQISSQIRFYEELAARERDNNDSPKPSIGLSDKERAKAAHQKMHTREDFINDLIRNGYTKEQATRVAEENGIV